MRLLILILCTSCLVLSGCFTGSTLFFLEPDDPNVPNLILNPSFEEADKRLPELPANWLVVSTLTDQSEPVTIDKDVLYAGRKSLKIEKSKRNMYLVSEAFKINYTAGYYSKMYIKSSKKMQKNARLYFWTYDTAGNKLNTYSNRIKGTFDWKKATISAGFFKNKAAFARVAIFLPKEVDNTIWIDETGCFVVHKFSNK